MRPIKFRAWDKTGKKIRIDIDELGMFSRSGKFEFAYPDDFILMQFTGLHDKNGKEIWEGDILRQKFKGFQRLGEVTA